MFDNYVFRTNYFTGPKPKELTNGGGPKLAQSAFDRVWYRYVVKGSAVFGGTEYSPGLYTMQPSPYALLDAEVGADGIQFIDILPSEDSPVSSIELVHCLENISAETHETAVVNGDSGFTATVNGTTYQAPLVLILRSNIEIGQPADVASVTMPPGSSVVVVKTAPKMRELDT